jgi:hypothetical protein
MVNIPKNLLFALTFEFFLHNLVLLVGNKVKTSIGCKHNGNIAAKENVSESG